MLNDDEVEVIGIVVGELKVKRRLGKMWEEGDPIYDA